MDGALFAFGEKDIFAVLARESESFLNHGEAVHIIKTKSLIPVKYSANAEVKLCLTA